MNSTRNSTANQDQRPSNFENYTDEQEREQQQQEPEEFFMHLKFDGDSNPMRHNINDLKVLGIRDGQLLIKIGDSYFMGQTSPSNQSTILFGYDPIHKSIQETHKSHSNILMQRVLLKPKNLD